MEQTINDFAQYSLLIPANYSNNVELSGLLVCKPKFETFEYKGRTCNKATFTLHQPRRIECMNKISDNLMVLETYSQQVISKLKEINKQCLVCCLGIVSRKQQKGFVSLGVNIVDIGVVRDSDFMLKEN